MKRKFKLTKLNIITVALVACVALIVAAAGGSIAYFTDAKETTNVFTAGSVYISLTEAAVKPDALGNLIEDTSKDRIVGNDLADANVVTHDYGKLFPGQSIYKDPTITNTGKDAAWVAAKIIITDGEGDITKLIGDPQSGFINVNQLLGGGVFNNGNIHVGTWNGMTNVVYSNSENSYNFAMIQASDTSSGTHEFYIYILEELAPNEAITVFDTMMINPAYGNEQMRELAQLNITVQAFAVQTFGFDSCYEAMNKAFSEHFTPLASV